MKLKKDFKLGLKIDKMVLHFYVTKGMYEAFMVHMFIAAGLEHLVYKPYSWHKVTSRRGGMFVGWEDLVLRLGDRELLRMEISHPDYKGPSLIVTYSPENAYLFGADVLVSKLLKHALTGPLSKWHLMGYIQRMDFAIDEPIKVGEVLALRSYTRKVKTVGEQDPSHYFTRASSESGFMYYNKYQQMLDCYGVDLHPQYDLTRIEFREEPREHIQFYGGYLNLKNPFIRVKMYDATLAFEIMDQYPEYAELSLSLKTGFLDQFTELLKFHLPTPYARRKLILRLDEHAKAYWWMPELSWEEVPSTLRRYETTDFIAV